MCARTFARTLMADMAGEHSQYKPFNRSVGDGGYAGKWVWVQRTTVIGMRLLRVCLRRWLADHSVKLLKTNIIFKMYP